MAGKPKRDVWMKGVFFRIPTTLVQRVEHCHALLQRQHGPKTTQNTAYERIIEAGCEALERTLGGSERASEYFSVPGDGFPEDTEEMPAPQRNGAAQVADTEQVAPPTVEAPAQEKPLRRQPHTIRG